MQNVVAAMDLFDHLVSHYLNENNYSTLQYTACTLLHGLHTDLDRKGVDNASIVTKLSSVDTTLPESTAQDNESSKSIVVNLIVIAKYTTIMICCLTVP